MRITQLRIKNFRSIKELVFDLGESTVFIGPNNSGKTAILDALRIALTRRWGQRGTGFTEYDVHLATENADPKQSPGVEIEIRAEEAQPNEWPEALNQELDEIIQTERIQTEMRKVYQLYQTDQISPDGFGKLYRPLEDQERSLSAELPKLQGEADALEMNELSSEVALEAADLYKQWPTFASKDKRRIIDSIVEKMVVNRDEIDITLCYTPSCEELTKRQRNPVTYSNPR